MVCYFESNNHPAQCRHKVLNTKCVYNMLHDVNVNTGIISETKADSIRV